MKTDEERLNIIIKSRADAVLSDIETKLKPAIKQAITDALFEVVESFIDDPANDPFLITMETVKTDEERLENALQLKADKIVRDLKAYQRADPIYKVLHEYGKSDTPDRNSLNFSDEILSKIKEGKRDFSDEKRKLFAASHDNMQRLVNR